MFIENISPERRSLYLVRGGIAAATVLSLYIASGASPDASKSPSFDRCIATLDGAEAGRDRLSLAITQLERHPIAPALGLLISSALGEEYNGSYPLPGSAKKAIGTTLNESKTSLNEGSVGILTTVNDSLPGQEGDNHELRTYNDQSVNNDTFAEQRSALERVKIKLEGYIDECKSKVSFEDRMANIQDSRGFGGDRDAGLEFWRRYGVIAFAAYKAFRKEGYILSLLKDPVTPLKKAVGKGIDKASAVVEKLREVARLKDNKPKSSPLIISSNGPLEVITTPASSAKIPGRVRPVWYIPPDLKALAGDQEQNFLIEAEVLDLPIILQTVNLSAGHKPKTSAVEDVTIPFIEHKVTALMGPSGSGKSTVLRCLDRMHENPRFLPLFGSIGTSTKPWVSGAVYFRGEDIYAPGVDPVQVRKRIGLVFQQPNPFPSMSIADNVTALAVLNNWPKRPNEEKQAETVEKCLKEVNLWKEVKDRLKDSGASLSGGQQQRLCIARALAGEPDILLLDEPCASLDMQNTLAIEELMRTLTDKYTIVLVTHNMQQAARVSDFTAMLYTDGNGQPGKVIEFGTRYQVFVNPKDTRTEGFVTGKIG